MCICVLNQYSWLLALSFNTVILKNRGRIKDLLKDRYPKNIRIIFLVYDVCVRGKNKKYSLGTKASLAI